MATESPAPSPTTIEDTLGSLDTIIDLVERQLSEARQVIARREPELERYREARALLSGDGDEPPPSSPPELKPDSDDDPPPAQKPSQAPAEASSQPPSPPATSDLPPRAVRTYNRRQAVLAFLRDKDQVVWGLDELVRTLPVEAISSKSTLLRDLAALTAQNELVHERGSGWRLPSATDAPSPPSSPKPPRPTPGDKPIEVHEGTPEGRILEYVTLNPQCTAPAIALGVEISLNNVRPILGRLMREGEVRAGHRGGETVYTATP